MIQISLQSEILSGSKFQQKDLKEVVKNSSVFEFQLLSKIFGFFGGTTFDATNSEDGKLMKMGKYETHCGGGQNGITQSTPERKRKRNMKHKDMIHGKTRKEWRHTNECAPPKMDLGLRFTTDALQKSGQVRIWALRFPTFLGKLMVSILATSSSLSSFQAQQLVPGRASGNGHWNLPGSVPFLFKLHSEQNRNTT